MGSLPEVGFRRFWAVGGFPAKGQVSSWDSACLCHLKQGVRELSGAEDLAAILARSDES